MNEDYKISRQKNGLTIASANIPHSAVVAINVLVKVGSRHESKKLNGISHLIEHMCFKGTKTRTAVQIAQEVENLGAFVNAYTSREHTVFFVLGLREYYEKLLDILADIVLNSEYSEEEIEKEKNVIIQEIAQTNDNPDEVGMENLQQLAYPNNLIGDPIIGNIKNVKSFTQKDIFSFVEKNYFSNNIIISVAGNIDTSLVEKTISEKFSKFSSGKKSDFDKPKFVGGSRIIEKELDQIHLNLAFEAIDYHSKDYYSAYLLSAILGDGISSRLFLEIREKLGLVYAIQSYLSPYHNTGTLGISAGTDADNLNLVIKKIAEEISKVKEHITDIELERVKNRSKANLLMGREVTSHRAAELASDIAIYDRYIEPAEVVKKINAVDKKQIIELANRIFVNKFAFTAVGKVKKYLKEDQLLKLFA